MNDHDPYLALQHEPEAVEKAELLWMKISISVLAVFLTGVAIVTALNFAVVPQEQIRGTTEELLTNQFANPRVEQISADEYHVYVLGRTWDWQPNPIRVRQGAKVVFLITSADLLHGFSIKGTDVNTMAIPSDVGQITYTFNTPGEYDVVCNEYCGMGHSTMVGKLIVERR